MKSTAADVAYLVLIGLFIWQLAGANILRAVSQSTKLLRVGAKSPKFAAGYRFGYIAGSIAATERVKNGA